VLRVLLNGIAAGIIVLDASAGVLDMNVAACEVTDCADGLVIEDSRLRAVRDGDDRRLQRVLRSAVSRRPLPQSEKLVSVPRHTGRRPYVVLARTIATPVDAGVPASPRAMIWVTDPERDIHVPETVLRKLWSLTAREAQVARLTVNGASRAEVARSLGLSDNAVRFHLKNIYRKTNTGGQAALVALAMRTTAGIVL